MDQVYRIPIEWGGVGRFGGYVVIEPSPTGDPFSVKVTLPMAGDVILPRDMFSHEVNERTGAQRIWRKEESCRQ